MKIKEISNNKQGISYSIKNDDDTTINITLRNVSLLFGLEKYKENIFYLKWNINDHYAIICFIEQFEEKLNTEFNTPVKSNIIRKNNYPIILNSKLIYTKNNNIILRTDNDISSIEEYIDKKNKYNVILEIKSVFKNKNLINYSILIKNISIAL